MMLHRLVVCRYILGFNMVHVFFCNMGHTSYYSPLNVPIASKGSKFYILFPLVPYKIKMQYATENSALQLFMNTTVLF